MAVSQNLDALGGYPSRNVGDRDYFNAVRQTDRPYISQPDKTRSINIAAPLKDSVSGQTIGIVRTSIPVKFLDDRVKNFVDPAQRYYLTDEGGQVFLSRSPQQIGSFLINTFRDLNTRQAAKKDDTFITVDKNNNSEQLVSYAQRNLEGLPDLKWQTLIATDTATAFDVQRLSYKDGCLRVCSLDRSL